jgi:RimJ/RimL family protein N-acetyltransferase
MESIHIRPMEMTDLDRIYEFRMDEEVMFWAAGGFGDAIFSQAQMENAVDQDHSQNADRTFVIEVDVEDAEDEEEARVVIGQISYRGFNRVNHSAEIGMFIGDRNYWSKGIGTEVVKQFVRMLFRRYNLHRIDIDTFSDNKRAIRCYEKCGFVVEGVRRKKFWTMNGYRDQVIMGLLREDWEKEHGEQVYYL